MSNRYSKYIPLGYEPVQTPLNVLAEVIKTKRQQNDSLENYLDSLGDYHAKALPGFMQERATQWNKGVANDIAALTDKAINQYNGDYTSLKGEIKKVGNRVKKDITTGEIGAIESAYKSFQDLSKQYAPDYKDNPDRFSTAQSMYLSNLKNPQEYNTDTGAYPNVPMFTPPPKNFDQNKFSMELAKAIPDQVTAKWEPIKGRDGFLYNKETKQTMKAPDVLQNAYTQNVLTNPEAVNDFKQQAKEYLFKTGQDFNNNGLVEATALQYIQQSSKNILPFAIGHYAMNPDTKALYWAPNSEVHGSFSANPFDLQDKKLKGLQNMLQDPLVGDADQFDATLLQGLKGSKSDMGIIDREDINKAFKDKFSLSSGMAEQKLGPLGSPAGPLVKNEVGIDVKKSSEAFKDPRIRNQFTEFITSKYPVNKNDASVLQKLIQNSIDNDTDVRNVIEDYNTYKTTRYTNQGGNSAYMPRPFKYKSIDRQIDATNEALDNDSNPVTIYKNGELVNSGKDGYTVEQMKKDYPIYADKKNSLSKSGAINAYSKRVTGWLPSVPGIDVPTKYMELGDGTVALIHSTNSANSSDNHIQTAINEITKGYTTGSSNAFPLVVHPGSDLASEMGVTKPTAYQFKVVGSRIKPDGKPILKFKIYTASGEELPGEHETDNVARDLGAKAANMFKRQEGKQINKITKDAIIHGHILEN